VARTEPVVNELVTTTTYNCGLWLTADCGSGIPKSHTVQMVVVAAVAAQRRSGGGGGRGLGLGSSCSVVAALKLSRPGLLTNVIYDNICQTYEYVITSVSLSPPGWGSGVRTRKTGRNCCRFNKGFLYNNILYCNNT